MRIRHICYAYIRVLSIYLRYNICISYIVVGTGMRWECVIGDEKGLMSGGWPLQSMGWFSTVGSVLVAVAE